MTQINQNYDMNNKYIGPREKPKQRFLQIPEYYNVSTEEHKDWREQLKSNPLTMVPYEFLLRGTEHPIATIATWLGLSFGLDAYSKSCRGEYDTSLLKKAANLGDNIQNSHFIQSQPSQSVLKGFKKVGSAMGKLTAHSSILRAIKNTPTMPEWSMVKQEMLPHKLKVCEDFFKIVNKLHLADEEKKPDKLKAMFEMDKSETAGLKDLAIDKTDKQAIKQFFNVTNVAKVPEEKAVNFTLLRHLGKTDNEIKKILDKGADATEITKNEIRKVLGMTKEELIAAQKAITEGIEKEIVDGKVKTNYYEQVVKATKAGGHKVKIRAGHYGILGPISRPFERIISCDEIHNKLWSISKGAKTATGRFLAKSMQMFQRGLTFGQGKLGLLLLIAPSVAEIGRNTIKAEPNEKIGTTFSGIVDSISWVFTFPAALYIMHSIGGIRYAGMTKEQVDAYRKALKEFNYKNKEFLFKTYEDYKTEKARIKEMLKVDKQNWFVKGIRKIARVLTLDLETFSGYKSKNIALRGFNKLPNFFKNCFGVPARFMIWAGISMFALEALLSKCVKMIFGRSYNAEKVEENKENKKAQKQFLKEDLKRRLFEEQAKKGRTQINQDKRNNKIRNYQTSSRGKAQLEQYQNMQNIPNTALDFKQRIQKEDIDNYTYIPSQNNVIPRSKASSKLDDYSYIPSQNNKLQPDDQNNPNKRSYIPSQRAANIEKIWDNSGLAEALRRADLAEQKALKVLNGNFEDMQ